MDQQNLCHGFEMYKHDIKLVFDIINSKRNLRNIGQICNNLKHVDM